MSVSDYQSVKYSFTLTLRPKLYDSTLDVQYDVTSTELVNRLKCLPSRVTVIAEITKYNCNIHYHGMIQFLIRSKDHIVDFHNLFRKSKIFGFKNIKQVDDERGWLEYISKELKRTKDIVGRPPILIDEFHTYSYIIQEDGDYVIPELILEQ